MRFTRGCLKSVSGVVARSSGANFLTSGTFGVGFDNDGAMCLPRVRVSNLNSCDHASNCPGNSDSLACAPCALGRRHNGRLFLSTRSDSRDNVDSLTNGLMNRFAEAEIVPRISTCGVSTLFTVTTTTGGILRPGTSSPITSLLAVVGTYRRGVRCRNNGVITLIGPTVCGLLRAAARLRECLSMDSFARNKLACGIGGLGNIPVVPMSDDEVGASCAFNSGNFTPTGGTKSVYTLILPGSDTSFIGGISGYRVLSPSRIRSFSTCGVGFEVCCSLVYGGDEERAVFTVTIPTGGNWLFIVLWWSASLYSKYRANNIVQAR